jgi:hypothetical protein
MTSDICRAKPGPWEKLNDLYSSVNIVRAVKSRTMRWVDHVARETYTGFLWGNLKEREHLGDPGVNGMLLLRWILKKCDGGGGYGLDRAGTG